MGYFIMYKRLGFGKPRGRKGGMRWPPEDSWNGSKTGMNPWEPRFIRKKTSKRRVLIFAHAFALQGRGSLMGGESPACEGVTTPCGSIPLHMRSL